MSAPSPTELAEFNELIWGHSLPNPEVFQRWSQGFIFSPVEPSALVQNFGGPCAVLAPVQAVILRDILCSRQQPASKFDELDGLDLLVSACLDLMSLVRCESKAAQYRWIFWSNSNDSDDTTDPACFFQGLKLVTADSTDELHGIILSLSESLQASYGILCFLYSILFTYGVSALRTGMADETESLIDPVHGHASQCLMNLLLTGHATPYVFDGVRMISGISMVGIEKQPRTGYLTLFEALRYCESGWNLKNPSNPVWILASETHFTVLASPEKRLVSEHESQRPGAASIHQAEVEFARLSVDQEDDKAGFIPTSQLATLLDTLHIPHTDQSIAQIATQLDPEELGIILQDAFLKHFFPQEMANRNYEVREFLLVHYNGLQKHDRNGQVRYEWGEARLLDPTEELSEPVDHNPMYQCLRTKWPTIRIKWKNERIPSLN